MRRLLFLVVALVGVPAIAFGQPLFDRRAEFTKIVPDFRKRQSALYERQRVLVEEIHRREARNERAICAHQILSEIEWLIGYTIDYERIDARLDEARAALELNDDEPDVASPIDGAWGRCASEWFYKLDFSYDHFAEDAALGRPAAVPPRFLDRINDPAALRASFIRLLTTNIEKTGRDNRRELNSTVSDAMRLILRDWPPGYAWHKDLKATLLDLLHNQMRDRQTGYWGSRYVTSSGIVQTLDLSLTFHIVSYLEGAVTDWPKLIDTTLAIKDRRYPNGWQSSVGYSNHHNMDVVDLMRRGWAYASPEQKAAMSTEIGKMMDWCLSHSLRADGSFAITPEDESAETAYYFGTSFLVRAGYFERTKRFWSDRDYPEATLMRQRLADAIFARLRSGGGAEGGYYYRNALVQLGFDPD